MYVCSDYNMMTSYPKYYKANFSNHTQGEHRRQQTAKRHAEERIYGSIAYRSLMVT